MHATTLMARRLGPSGHRSKMASSSSTSTSSTSSDQQSDNLPHWSSAVMKVLLVQPSSAAAERDSLFLTHRLTTHKSMLSWTIYRLA